MGLTRAQVEDVLSELLAVVPVAEYRLVGTASSVLRGIDLPATDVDILFRDRSNVDQWFEALSARNPVETAPEWIPDAKQYFARLVADGVTVELSTVEWGTSTDTTECIGPGPWRYFDELDIRGGTVATVANELRLITEVARSRPDRSDPIVRFLRANGCDVALVRRGLTNVGVELDTITRVVDELLPAQC
jgi:hypothetical protein